ncbi:Carboxypeptidase 2 [Colletotrichum tanaceti]|nr:Carboxypeptidase 2 [Colletotrichum tanaceti]
MLRERLNFARKPRLIATLARRGLTYRPVCPSNSRSAEKRRLTPVPRVSVISHPLAMRVLDSLAFGLLHAGIASAQKKYADNQLPVMRDSDLVSKLFPDVDVELLSPAFTNPEAVPAGWSNGTSGPTDQGTLDSFLRGLADKHGWLTYHQSPFMSEDGRSIPYVNLSLSPPSAAAAAAPADRLRIWIQGGVHGDEPAGDEAVLALLGKFAANETWTLCVLSKVDIIVVPRYNPDGVAYFQRGLASNYDPNRDHAILQRRQTRDVKRLLSAYDPHVFLDAHEYAASQALGASRQWLPAQDIQVSHVKNPNIHPAIRALGEGLFLTAIQDRVRRHGLRTSAYFITDDETDLPVLTEPSSVSRPGHNSAGLLQAVSFLAETRGIRLADQHFQRRVAAGSLAIEALVQTAVDNADEVLSTIKTARRDFVEGTGDIVVADSARVTNTTWDFVDVRSGTVVSVPVQFRNNTPSQVDLVRARPEAYVFPRAWADVAEKLEILGVEVETLSEDFVAEAEVLTVKNLTLENSKYEGIAEATVTTSASRKVVRVPKGGFRVSTRQKNAAFAFVTLEPENTASFVRYNLIDLSVGDEYPVFRVLGAR